MQVNLIKIETQYVDKKDNNKTKTATSFFVECGDELIGVQVVYYKNKNGEPDKTYLSRKAILSAFASPMSYNDSNSCHYGLNINKNLIKDGKNNVKPQS